MQPVVGFAKSLQQQSNVEKQCMNYSHSPVTILRADDITDLCICTLIGECDKLTQIHRKELVVHDKVTL